MILLTNKKFERFVWVTVLIIITFLAYQDTIGLAMFGTVGGYNGDTFPKMSELYMQQFWTFAFAIIAGVSAMFYFFRRDISESVAIISGSYILLWSGLEDIIYYWMIGRPGLDQSMPWLFDKIPGWVSKYLLRLDTVTPMGLYLQLAIGTVVTFFIIKWLKKQNKILGVKV